MKAMRSKTGYIDHENDPTTSHNFQSKQDYVDQRLSANKTRPAGISSTQFVARTDQPRPIGAKTQSQSIVKVTFRPYTAQTTWLSHPPAGLPNEPIVLADGMTIDQWRKINSFKIVGQSKYKKRNYNLAVDHFFNMRSMYKKINSIWIGNKNPQRPKGQDSYQVASETRQSQVLNPGVSRVVTSTRQSQVNHELRHVEDWGAQNREGQVVNGRYAGQKMTNQVKVVKTRPSNNSDNYDDGFQGNEGPKRKIKPTKKKSKVTSNGVGESPEDGEGADLEDFRNTNEKELIESSINLAGLGHKASHQPKTTSQLPRKVSQPDKFTSSKSKKGVESDSNFGSERNKQRIIESEVIQKGGVRGQHLPTDNDEDDIEEEEPFDDSVNPISRNSRHRDTHQFDTADIQNKIKMTEGGEGEEGEGEGEDEEDIMDKIPILQGNSEDELQQFKQQLMNTIITYEIFDDEEFQNFFEAVCLRNQSLTRQFLADIFEEIKTVLMQQFQELNGQEAEENE